MNETIIIRVLSSRTAADNYDDDDYDDSCIVCNTKN